VTFSKIPETPVSKSPDVMVSKSHEVGVSKNSDSAASKSPNLSDLLVEGNGTAAKDAASGLPIGL
jgi:hypothetical protein